MVVRYSEEETLYTLGKGTGKVDAVLALAALIQHFNVVLDRWERMTGVTQWQPIVHEMDGQMTLMADAVRVITKRESDWATPDPAQVAFEKQIAELAAEWRIVADKSNETGEGWLGCMSDAGVYDKFDSLMEAWEVMHKPKAEPFRVAEVPPGTKLEPVQPSPFMPTLDAISNLRMVQKAMPPSSWAEQVQPTAIIENVGIPLSPELSAMISGERLGEVQVNPKLAAEMAAKSQPEHCWLNPNPTLVATVSAEGEIVEFVANQTTEVEDSTVPESWSKVYPNGFGIPLAVNHMMCLGLEHLPGTMPDWGGVRYSAHEFGWIVFVYPAMEADKIPDWLKPIWHAAILYRCRMIEFDESAPIYEELPTYEY